MRSRCSGQRFACLERVRLAGVECRLGIGIAVSRGEMCYGLAAGGRGLEIFGSAGLTTGEGETRVRVATARIGRSQAMS